MVREGCISKIIYQNPDNGYAVFVVETRDGGEKEDEVFVGTVAGIAAGLFIQAEGEYVHHPQYDIQFRVDSAHLMMPDDTEGVIRFLGSGIIKGVGEALSKRIVKKFGTDTLRILDEEPERLAEVRGISEAMAGRIGVSYSENKAVQHVISFLTQYGISVRNGLRIYHAFGDEVYGIIRDNPYQIAEKVPNIGFRTADAIAMKAGIPEDSDYRIHAAISYVLNQAQGLGHMYLPENWLSEKTLSLLALPEGEEAQHFREHFHDILIEMAMDGRIILKEDEGETAVYSKRNYHLELASARLLTDLELDFHISPEELSEAIREVEREEKITLEDMQKQAVETAITSGVSVITGGPGTGKTTIINAIIRYFEMQGKEPVLAAPTGRAAKRITESTGYPASTIHRLLEFSGDPDEGDGPEDRTSYHFNRNSDHPLETEAIIIDEASMIDSSLFYSLLSAVTPGTRLVLVGDTDQLPPVGAGNVLHDIIDSGCFPVITLNRIFRQAEGSTIVQNAHRIKNGEHIEISNKSSDFFFIPRQSVPQILEEVDTLILRNLPGYLHISPYDIQVLTPMRHYELGVEELNRHLQQTMNPASPDKQEKRIGDVLFREGDKVMQIRNDYKMEWQDGDTEGIGVFNGDMGVLKSINDFDERITIRFDDGREADYEYSQMEEVEHAFAITIHKSQGSEYPAVIIPLLSGPRRLLNRNLFYTAVTRARQLVVLVGNIGLANRMIDNAEAQKRFTSFDKRLREMREV